MFTLLLLALAAGLSAAPRPARVVPAVPGPIEVWAARTRTSTAFLALPEGRLESTPRVSYLPMVAGPRVSRGAPENCWTVPRTPVGYEAETSAWDDLVREITGQPSVDAARRSAGLYPSGRAVAL